jgi:hypothetical protein
MQDPPVPAPVADDPVPVFGSWPRIYTAVIVCALVVMAAIAFFSRWNF